MRARRRRRVDRRQCGQYRLGPATPEAGDPFGIAGAAEEIGSGESILVLPEVLDVTARELPCAAAAWLASASAPGIRPPGGGRRAVSVR